MRSAWIGWTLVAAGCFAESPMVDSSAGTTAGDDGASSTADGGSETADAETAAPDSSGEPGPEILFDFFAEVCGNDVYRAGNNDMPDVMTVPIDCGVATAVGLIETVDEGMTTSGPAERMIVLTLPEVENSSLGFQTVMEVPLSSGDAPKLQMELDCGATPDASYNWAVSYAFGDGGYESVQTGQHDCTSGRMAVEVPLTAAEDRAVSIAVVDAEARMTVAVLIDPLIVPS